MKLANAACTSCSAARHLSQKQLHDNVICNKSTVVSATGHNSHFSQCWHHSETKSRRTKLSEPAHRQGAKIKREGGRRALLQSHCVLCQTQQNQIQVKGKGLKSNSKQSCPCFGDWSEGIKNQLLATHKNLMIFLLVKQQCIKKLGKHPFML